MGRIQRVPEHGQVTNTLERKRRATNPFEVTRAESNAGFVAR